MSFARVLPAAPSSGTLPPLPLSRRRVELADSAFDYDSRDTVARSLLGQDGADWLWGVLVGKVRGAVWHLLQSLGYALCLAMAFHEPLASWSVAFLACLLVLPAHTAYFGFLNRPLLFKCLGSFDALFLTAQILIACVGEASILGWHAHALSFFGVCLPAYFTLVVSDACHHSFRPQTILMCATGLLISAALVGVLIVHSGKDRIEVEVLSFLSLMELRLPHESHGVQCNHDHVHDAVQDRLSLLAASGPAGHPSCAPGAHLSSRGCVQRWRSSAARVGRAAGVGAGGGRRGGGADAAGGASRRAARCRSARYCECTRCRRSSCRLVAAGPALGLARTRSLPGAGRGRLVVAKAEAAAAVARRPRPPRQ